MTARILLTLVAAATVAGCSSSRGAGGGRPAVLYEPVRGNDWQLLGSRKVNYRAERDVIPVGGRAGTLRRIRIEVDNADVDLYSIVVRFRDGSRFAPDTRFNFREGSRSRVIDLPGRDRRVQRVEFRYRTDDDRGRGRGRGNGPNRAVVRLYGR